MLPRQQCHCVLTHVPHGDGTDARRSLHLPTRRKLPDLTDWNVQGSCGISPTSV